MHSRQRRKIIDCARMKEVQRLLKYGTNTNIVAKDLHFTSPNQLYRIYKRHFGHTIRQADA